MKTILCKTDSEWIDAAARIVCKQLTEGRREAVLALTCGETMRPLWDRMAQDVKRGAISLRDVRILCVTELCGVPAEKSCRYRLTKGLLEKTDAKSENCFFPDPGAPEAYDALIEALGGIDLAVLGIGQNCHIGYNEPGTLFDSRTHVQKLTDRTKRQLAERGFTDADIPERAVTMGVKTLTDARELLLLARGAEKSAAVFQMLYAKTTSYIPAAYLQIPLNVTAVLDAGAAEKL